MRSPASIRPGSTFKPLTALAAISDGLLSPYEYIQCTPIAYYGLDRHPFENWNPYTNQAMTLTTALAQSCDTYFYDVGNRYFERGEHDRPYWTRMQDWAKPFGFGAVPGLDVGGDTAGLIPTPAWRKQHFKTAIDRAWNPGELIQLAIGQKDITVTPLQMARFYAAIANGGKLVTPYVVSAVEQLGTDDSSSVTLRTFPPKPPRAINVDGTALRTVQEGLYAGDARRARAPPRASSAASRCRWRARPGPPRRSSTCPGYPAGHLESQAWWCGWGPYNGTEYNGRAPIAVCVVIENGGHGGTAAAPAALEVFEEWFGEHVGVQAEVPSD